jgi:hypothetical protein
LALITVFGLVVGGMAFAQTETPPDQTTPATPGQLPWGKGFGCMGGRSWGNFDAMAKALNLAPTALFEKLHGGQTLADIAKEQGVDLTKVQEAANAERVQAMKDAIAQAVKDGKITQEQANWMLRGWSRLWARAGLRSSAVWEAEAAWFQGGPDAWLQGGLAPEQAPSSLYYPVVWSDGRRPAGNPLKLG